MGWNSLTARAKSLNASAITPNDAEDIIATAGIYVGVSGDLRVTLAEMADGSHVTFTDLAAGIIHPLVVKRVWNTGTTATDIVAVY